MTKIINLEEAREKADFQNHEELIFELFDGDSDGLDGWDLALLCNRFRVIHLIGIRYEGGAETRVAFVCVREASEERPGLVGVFTEASTGGMTNWGYKWWCDEFYEFGPTETDIATKEGSIAHFSLVREEAGIPFELYEG